MNKKQLGALWGTVVLVIGIFLIEYLKIYRGQQLYHDIVSPSSNNKIIALAWNNVFIWELIILIIGMLLIYTFKNNK